MADYNNGDVERMFDEIDLKNVNQSDMSSLSSSWLQYGIITWNKGESTGKAELLMGGKGYTFPAFPLDVWELMKQSESAGKVLWDTVWFRKRVGSVGKASAGVTKKLTRKQKTYTYKQKGLVQRRQKTLKNVRALKQKRLGKSQKTQKKQRRK